MSREQFIKSILEYALQQGFDYCVADYKSFKQDLYTERCKITPDGLDFALSWSYNAHCIKLFSEMGDEIKLIL